MKRKTKFISEEENKGTLKKNSKTKLLASVEKVDLEAFLCQGDDENAMEIILSMSNLDEKIGQFDDSALIMACRLNNKVIAKNLIELNANVNFINNYGWTALINASKEGHYEIVELLVKAGADVNPMDEDDDSALSRAAEKGYIDIVKLLLSSGVNEICRKVALMEASFNGHFEIVKMLIESGININSVDPLDGATALHLVCKNGFLNIVEYLLNNGADENLKDCRNKTPIDYSKTDEVKEFVANYNSSKFVLK